MTELTEKQKQQKVERQRQRAIEAKVAVNECNYTTPVVLIILGVFLTIIFVGIFLIIAGVILAIIRAVNKPKLEAMARSEVERLEDMCEEYGFALEY